ncbi:MAG TPA: DUF2442 domain-containing protein [Thermoanaerobaculia bacterium]|nr:DUF2442 domain-containing protein [Thermoanaerobaculia bacterium]
MTDTDERAVEATVTASEIVVRLTDGRTVSVPLAWFPRLLEASDSDRQDIEIIGDGVGLHWPALDEDLSVTGLVRGVRPQPHLTEKRLRVERAEARISAAAPAAPADDERIRRFHATLARLERDVQQFVCPIYGVRGDEGRPIGSGFLLGLADQTVLITAAHVLHARHEFNLQMPGQTRAVPFGGAAYSTGPRENADSPEFEHDIAFLVLDTDAMLEPPGTPVLSAADLDVADLPTRQTAYGFVGFPGSQNKALPDYKFMRSSFYYGGQPAAQDKYERLGYDPRTHFVMSFERERMVDKSGRVVAVPEPYGMSGGPVFKLGTFEEIDRQVATPRVVALTIEWWQRLDVLVGVRVALLTETIRQLLPELGAELPVVPHFSTSVTLNEI